MKVNVKLEGLDAVQAALREAVAEAQGNVDVAVQATAQGIQRHIQRTMASGQDPQSRSGDLARSITYTNEGPGRASVSSDLDYAWYLEFGTRNMHPRPVWIPTAEQSKAELRAAVAEAVKEALQ